jgi:hypothetical protein
MFYVIPLFYLLLFLLLVTRYWLLATSLVASGNYESGDSRRTPNPPTTNSQSLSFIFSLATRYYFLFIPIVLSIAGK